MDKLITRIYEQDLNGTDIDYLTKGKAKVILYEDLQNVNNILDIFGLFDANLKSSKDDFLPQKKGSKTFVFDNVIMLFPVKSNTNGHWIAIMKNNKTQTITHWDPYGFSWIEEMPYTQNKYVKMNLLGNLYNLAKYNGWNVQWNKYKFQEQKNNINTCGRHCCIRVRFDYLDNDKYAKMMLNQKMKPDWIVTCLTFVSLDEDEADEQTIKSLL